MGNFPSERSLLQLVMKLMSMAKKKKIKSDHDQDSEWRERFGEKGAKVIRDSVNANITDYEYLKQFAVSV